MCIRDRSWGSHQKWKSLWRATTKDRKHWIKSWWKCSQGWSTTGYYATQPVKVSRLFFSFVTSMHINFFDNTFITWFKSSRVSKKMEKWKSRECVRVFIFMFFFIRIELLKFTTKVFIILIKKTFRLYTYETRLKIHYGK